MRQFELRFIDQSGTVVFMRSYTANDEVGAVSEASKLCSEHSIEVWEGTKMVARVQKSSRL